MSDQNIFSGRCPMCGYSDKSVVKPVTNEMNSYKNERGETATMNSSQKEIVTANGTWKLQPKDISQEITIIRPVSSKDLEGLRAKALTDVVAPSIQEVAGDPTTGLAKGATIKFPKL